MVVSSGVDLEGIQSGELEGTLVLPSLAGTGDIPVTSEVSWSLRRGIEKGRHHEFCWSQTLHSHGHDTPVHPSVPQ